MHTSVTAVAIEELQPTGFRVIAVFLEYNLPSILVFEEPDEDSAPRRGSHRRQKNIEEKGMASYELLEHLFMFYSYFMCIYREI